MEKMRLSMDELQVQSFATTGTGEAERGTVHGHDNTDPAACPTADPAWETCWASCDGWDCGSGNTCDNSCNCGSPTWLASGCFSYGVCW